MSGPIPGRHEISGWQCNHWSGAGYYAMPTPVETRVSWSAESCMDHPDPARGEYVIHCPTLVADLLDLQIGGRVRSFVDVRDATGELAYCAYDEGYLDEVQRERIRRRGVGQVRPELEDWHSVPWAYSYATTSASVTATMVNRGGIGNALTRNSGYANPGRGGHRLVLDNRGSDPATVTIGAMLDASPTSGVVGEAGGISVGRPDPGRLAVIAVVERGEPRSHTIKVGDDPIGPQGGPPVQQCQASKLDGRLVTTTVTLAAGEHYECIIVGAQLGGARHVTDRLMVRSSDALAILGRTKVGTVPWGRAYLADRIRNQLAPIVGDRITLDAWPYRDGDGFEPGAAQTNAVIVAARDVDNMSALDVYRRTVASAGRVALGLAERVGQSWALRPTKSLVKVGDAWAVVVEAKHASRVPIVSIPDVPVTLSTDRVANRYDVDVRERSSDGTVSDATVTIRADESVRLYGEVGRKIETEIEIEPGVPARASIAAASPRLDTRSRIALRAQSQTRWHLADGVQVIARDLGAIVALAELIDNARRYGRLVQLIGGGLPPEVSPYQRVRGSVFGFGADGAWHLQLDVEPADFSGPETALFGEIASFADMTLGSFGTTTIGDLKDVGV